MFESIAQSLVGTALNEWILATFWLWPIMEIIHFIGLTLLLGGLLIVDLRMLGTLKLFNTLATHQLLAAVLFGFSLNLITGILFFIGDPMRYSQNIGFKIKMVLILIAGLNAAFFHWRTTQHQANRNDSITGIKGQKLTAGLSLFLWMGVLLLGRLIPYVGTG